MVVLNARRLMGLAVLGALAAAMVVVVSLPDAEAGQTKCFGKTPTITSNAAIINGTNGNDVILAGNGDNQINARDGQDWVCARGGNDNIDGGLGATSARGGGGKDNFEGRGAADLFYGGGG